MGGVASAVSDVVGGAVDTVGDAVSDVGDAVVDNIVEPVVKTVDNTIQAAIDDPVGTAVKVAAISTGNPAIIAAANAAVAVANGADLSQAALAAGKGYAAGAIGAEVSADLQPEFAQSGDLTASQAAAAAKVAGQVAGTTAVGGDPVQALISGGIGAGTAAVTSEIPGFADMSKAQQAAANSAISKTLQGRDPSQGLINEAIVAGVSAAQNYASAPSDELMKQTVTAEGPAPTPTPAPTPDVAAPPTTETPAPSTELVEQTVPTQNQEQLIAAAPVDDFLNSSNEPININAGLLGYNTAESLSGLPGADANAPDNIDVGGGWNPSSYLSSDPNAPDNMDVGGGWSPATGATEEELQAARDALDAQDPFKQLDKSSTDLGALARSLLASTPNGVKTGMAGLGAALGARALLSGEPDALSYTREAVQNQGVNWNPQAGSVNNGVAYGLDQLGTNYTTNAAQGGIMSLAMGGSTGNLGGYAAGGNPQLLRGPGDGMSDNIPASIAGKRPARLADGEFVIPADVVSHLGNGSTEAGANVLHQMMDRVRKARTGNPNQGKQINPQKFVPRKGK